MAENGLQIIAIEWLAAAQGIHFHRPLVSSAMLERVRALLRVRVPPMDADRFVAPDIAAAADLIRNETMQSEVADVLGIVEI